MPKTIKTTVHRISKTQQAYEGALAGDKDAVKILIGMAIVKCRGIWPPISTDEVAETLQHAHNRYRANRYAWIKCWLTEALNQPLPGDTGSRVVTRCRWRLLDVIREEYAERRREARENRGPKRVRRKNYPSKEQVLDTLSTLPTPDDPVLRDLWERLIEAYPDWRATTNRQLAAILGVHENVIASRRHALALLQHTDASDQHAELLHDCLRLKIGKVRRTDLNRIESQADLSEILSDPKEPRHEYHFPVERIRYIGPTRCSHMNENGSQCLWTQSKCPDHRSV
jgi:hypothetical protein